MATSRVKYRDSYAYSYEQKNNPLQLLELQGDSSFYRCPTRTIADCEGVDLEREVQKDQVRLVRVLNKT